LHCPEWELQLLASPHATRILDPLVQDENIPFAPAKELDVDIPIDNWGKGDDFIDDRIAIAPNFNNIQNRAI
jgi:hypothetical protein